MNESAQMPAEVKKTITAPDFPKAIALSALEAYDKDQKRPDILEQPVFQNSVLKSMLATQGQEEPNLPAVMLFSDIDGTFIISPSDAEQEQLPAYQAATTQIEDVCQNKHIPIALTTGRDLSKIQKGQPGGEKHDREKLPLAPLLITAAGTEVFVLQNDNTYLPDLEFEKYLISTTGFKRELLYPECVVLIDKLKQTNPMLSFRFQPQDDTSNVEAWQTPDAKNKGLTQEDPPQKFKISFFFEGNANDGAMLKEFLFEDLKTLGLDKVKVVICFGKYLDESEQKILYNVDLVPVTKEEAVNYYTEKLSVLGITAGDSGNDERMVIAGGDVGIIVGGAKAELQEGIDREVARIKAMGEVTIINQSFTQLQISEELERTLIHEDNRDHKGPQTLLKVLQQIDQIRKKVFGGQG